MSRTGQVLSVPGAPPRVCWKQEGRDDSLPAAFVEGRQRLGQRGEGGDGGVLWADEWRGGSAAHWLPVYTLDERDAGPQRWPQVPAMDPWVSIFGAARDRRWVRFHLCLAAYSQLLFNASAPNHGPFAPAAELKVLAKEAIPFMERMATARAGQLTTRVRTLAFCGQQGHVAYGLAGAWHRGEG